MITLKQAKKLLQAQEARLKEVKNNAEISIKEHEEALKVLKSLVVSLCPHTNIREEDAHDYHNNCPWTAQYCIDCGIYLGKY